MYAWVRYSRASVVTYGVVASVVGIVGVVTVVVGVVVVVTVAKQCNVVVEVIPLKYQHH